MVFNPVIFGFSLGAILTVAAIIDIVLFIATRKALIYPNTIGALLKGILGVKISGIVLAIIFGVIGVMMVGGFGVVMASVSGIVTPSEEVITPVPSSCIIEKARYSVIQGVDADVASNTTLTSDDNNLDRYFLDTYNTSIWINTASDIDGNLTLWLEEAPVTGSECNAMIYWIGPSFKDQISTGSAADDIYDLFGEDRTQSDLKGITAANRVDDIIWRQQSYLSDTTAASTTSDQEITVVNFAAGELTNTLQFEFDFAQGSYTKIKKNNQVDLLLKQQSGSAPSSSDPTIFTVTMRKGVLG